jgi:hypothetical protein
MGKGNCFFSILTIRQQTPIIPPLKTIPFLLLLIFLSGCIRAKRTRAYYLENKPATISLFEQFIAVNKMFPYGGFNIRNGKNDALVEYSVGTSELHTANCSSNGELIYTDAKDSLETAKDSLFIKIAKTEVFKNFVAGFIKTQYLYAQGFGTDTSYVFFSYGPARPIRSNRYDMGIMICEPGSPASEDPHDKLYFRKIDEQAYVMEDEFR